MLLGFTFCESLLCCGEGVSGVSIACLASFVSRVVIVCGRYVGCDGGSLCGV